ncbi:MAG: lytic transglycosylase domain-containing protein [Chromatiaceae bacterium]|nr:MAG: lytic transglycosylase domain-containing protein [Chromatiaceae bacterium]
MIDRLAQQYGVERDLVHAVIAAESAYRPHAVSPVGAVGIMQVMPATAADYGVHSIDALFDTETNIRTGIRHLRRLLGKYPVGQAVMAYNAGEGALERSGGFVTYAETQRYAHRVLTSYLRTKNIAPYSAEAQTMTGIALTPAMARAGATRPASAAVSTGTRARPLLRQVDVSKLSLRVRPTLSNRALDPAAHRTGPDSQPMFVLDPTLRR